MTSILLVKRFQRHRILHGQWFRTIGQDLMVCTEEAHVIPEGTHRLRQLIIVLSSLHKYGDHYKIVSVRRADSLMHDVDLASKGLAVDSVLRRKMHVEL